MAKCKPAPQAATEGINKQLGRPSGFRPEFGPEIERLCRLGMTDRDICLHFEVSYQTVENWKKNHPEFFVKILRGKQEADAEVAGKLYKNAMGYDFYEEVAIKCRSTTGYDKNDKPIIEERVEVVRVLKHQPADTTAQIFWLKNRRPELWRDAKHIEAGPEFMKNTISGDPVMKELQQRGFVILENEYVVEGGEAVKEEPE